MVDRGELMATMEICSSNEAVDCPNSCPRYGCCQGYDELMREAVIALREQENIIHRYELERRNKNV